MPRGTPFRSEILATPATGFVAAAKNYTIGKANRTWTGKGRQGGIEWQEAAWNFYDTVGEYRYGVDWVGNLLSKAVLFVTGPDGKPTADPLVQEAMDALFGGPEGQAEMLRMLGIQFTVAGEAYIVGMDTNGQDDWFVIAATEISKRDGSTFTFGQGEDKVVAETNSSMVIRIWRPHPRTPKRSASPSRACLPILSEIERLTMHVAAQLDSRLTSAGMLILPSQFSFPTLPSRNKTNQGDPEPGESVSTQVANPAQAFADLLVSVAEIAIDAPQDASAKVPIVIQVDGEYIDKVQFLKFWTDLDQHAIELRKEAIGRLGLGLDMPPEILTGTADVNHWGSWQIEEAAIKSHSEPLLQVITSSLTVGYLRPVLESLGMDAEQAFEFNIEADDAAMRMRPNRSKEAMELYDRGVLSKEAVVRENGFSETDVMDEAERTEWLTVKLAEGQTTPELVAQGLALLGVPITAPAEPAEETHEQRPIPTKKDHPVRDIPRDGDAPAEGDNVPEELLAASQVVVYRALEKAGNKLKNRLSGSLKDEAVAAELYMRMPRLSDREMDSLLEGAWTCLDRFDLPSDIDTLAGCLDSYTRTIISLRKPPDRDLLREHLALMRLEHPASV